ncbi:MAG: hypothetical protein GKS05_08085 [Nitrospirales bacterium]|nr:hypothetical protein [Nitrospirales bacterium]
MNVWKTKHQRPDPTPILLSAGLDAADAVNLLTPYGFQDPSKADANLQAMAGDPQARQGLAAILYELLTAVSATADPDQALNEWDRYLESGVRRVQLFTYLAQAPHLLHLLCTIFGNSPAMAQTLHRTPLLIYWLGEEQVLTNRVSRPTREKELQASLAPFATAELKLDALRRFNRRELLRIGVQDLSQRSTVPETVTALSDLATLIIQTAYEIVDDEMKTEYGVPMHRNRHGQFLETGFVVLGMGKLGGRELNYSSDVDLIYAYASSDGETQGSPGQKIVPNEMYFETLARKLTQVLSVATQEGALFRVDLRLRPEGTVGPLVHSIDTAVQYYQTRGRDWERLAFLKARPIAGTVSVGQALLRRIRPFILGDGDHSEQAVFQTIRSLKSQIHAKMVRREETIRNVKLGTGGIREIEFIVQGLQLLHGRRQPRILDRNSLTALKKLRHAQLLDQAAVEKLSQAYVFLRNVEHKLQMVYELQTHSLPIDQEEIGKCAIRLGYQTTSSHDAGAALLTRYQQVTQSVRQEFVKLFYHTPTV